MMPRNFSNYPEDFYGWTIEQSRLLRSGELSAIDAANIAEEIESIGRSDRRELKSRLVVLVAHLLKWRHQPGGPITQLVGDNRRAKTSDRRNPRWIAQSWAKCGRDARGPSTEGRVGCRLAQGAMRALFTPSEGGAARRRFL
jgi:hypothetical protein